MTRSASHTDIRSKIDTFVEELSALVRQSALDSVRKVLGVGAAPARRRPGRTRIRLRVSSAAKPAMRGGKRTAEQVDAMAQRVATYVRSNPGQRLEQIAAGLGTASHDLKLPVIKLLASRTLRKTGKKRGTQYFTGGRTSTKRGKRR